MRSETAAKVIEQCARFTYPSGDKAGQPVELLPHEIAFIEGLFADGVSRGALSMPRGNGKTSFLAMLAALALVKGGALVKPGSDVVIVAASIDQGNRAGRNVEHYLKSWHGKAWYDKKASEDEAANRGWMRTTTGPSRRMYGVRFTATSGSIENREDGVFLRVAGSDPKTMHGKVLSFALLDEPAQWHAYTRNQMHNAVATALGKMSGARMVVIGTRSEDDTHWYSAMLKMDSPSIHSAVFAAGENDDPGDLRVWLDCNPLASAHPPLLKALQDEWNLVGDSRNRLRAFRAYRLNQGVRETQHGSALIEMDDHDRLDTLEHVLEKEGMTFEDLRGGYVLGVDLGSHTAMSAAVRCLCFTEEDGSNLFHAEGIAMFGAGLGLAERAEEDRVGNLYEQAHQSGRLLVDAEGLPSVRRLLEHAKTRWGNPLVVAADSFRRDDLEVAVRFVFGASPQVRIIHTPEQRHADVQLLRTLVDTRALLRSDEEPLMRHALAGARVVTRASMDKLARSNEAGRLPSHKDDMVAAMLPALGEIHRLATNPAPRRYTLTEVV